MKFCVTMKFLYKNPIAGILTKTVAKDTSQKQTQVISAWFSCTNQCASTKAIAEAKPLTSIPGPRVLPLIGSVYKYIAFGSHNVKDREKIYKQLYEKYGKIAREYLPPLNHVHIFDPDDVRQILQAEDKAGSPRRFKLHAIAAYKEKHGYSAGLPNGVGEDWRKQRKPTQNILLRPAMVAQYIEPTYEIAQDFVNYIRNRRDDKMLVTDMRDKFQRFALEVIGVLLFDKKLGVLKNKHREDEFADQFLNHIKSFMSTESNVTVKWYKHKKGNTKEWKKFEDMYDFFYQTSENAVTELQAKIKQGSYQESKLPFALLTSTGLDRRDVVDILVNLLVGGTETTANSMVYICYNLAKNPEVQQLLFEELEQHITEENTMTSAVLEELKYLKAVVKEQGRLSPLVSGTSRMATIDHVIQGYHITPGTHLLLHMYSGHAGIPKSGIDEPGSFMPERWLKSSGHKNKIHPFASLTFGYGARMCIGKRIAQLEMYMMFSQTIKNFTVEYNGPDLSFETLLIQNPEKKMDFIFKDRS